MEIDSTLSDKIQESTTHENSLLFEEQSDQQNEEELEKLNKANKPSQNVTQTRINNELKNLQNTAINFKYDDTSMTLYVLDELANIKLDLSHHFPFDAPLISIELKDKELFYSLHNLENITFEDIMKEHWHPSIKILDIAEKTLLFTKKNTVKVKFITNMITKLTNMTTKSMKETFSDKTLHIEAPLHYNINVGLGYLLELMSGQDLKENLDTENVLLIGFLLRFVAMVTEIIFILLPLTLLVNTLHLKFSKTFKLNLLLLIYFSPMVIFMSSVKVQTAQIIVSTVFLGFFVTFIIVYVPILASEQGVAVAERVFSRQYLENYKSFDNNLLLTGNIWSFTQMIKNGNLVSIILFFFAILIIFFTVLRLSDRRFLKIAMIITQIVISFGIIQNRLLTLQTLVILLLGLLYKEYQPLYIIYSILSTLVMIDQSTISTLGEHKTFMIIYIVIYYFQCRGFSSMIEDVILISKQKVSDKSKQQDEEINFKKKGIINEYFKADKASYSFQFGRQTHSVFSQGVMNIIRLIHLVGISLVPITYSFWYKGRIQKIQPLINIMMFVYNLILLLYIFTQEFIPKDYQVQCNHQGQACQGHNHDHQNSQSHTGHGNNQDLRSDLKSKES
ncbi:UNKNOWN [Stylonychia lemnae]|uniref:Transmembrane protein n=1 Tax=Stylonychia lemnae TaxID=5949 RepID=A0A077ZXF5_STYLE|nr:UNKNOWN [Stylonychia lemnae]|eukprot:CDW74236.1 UNKNOWN [Stylonychia lemnae]